jgi:mRNA guanylyltransferase
LLVWQGDREYKVFDQLGITEEEWKKQFGKNPKYMDGKIIECNYDPEVQQRLGLPSPWRFMRYRDDKLDGNFQSVVDNVLNSIRDAVSKEQVRLIIFIRDTLPNNSHLANRAYANY